MKARSILITLAQLLRFAPYYLWEMTCSNLKIARDVLRPKPQFTPGFVELDLSAYTPIERWGVACLISMTPGTLSVDLSEATKILQVHTLYLTDPAGLQSHLERLAEKAFGKSNHSAAS